MCPCVNCGLVLHVTRSEAYEYLICDRFIEGYTKWVCHGETTSTDTAQNAETQSYNEKNYDIDMQGLLNDVFRQSSYKEHKATSNDRESIRAKPNAEA